MNKTSYVLSFLFLGGFFLSSLFAEPTPIGSDYVTIDDAGNAADSQGKGAVPYEFQVAKNDFTYSELLAMLNKVATQSDPHNLWTSEMSAYITRKLDNNTYTYALASADKGNLPVCLPLHSIYRVINWYQNGKPHHSEGNDVTETGTYDLRNEQPDQILTPQAYTTYRLPTDDEYQKWTYFAPQKSTYASPAWGSSFPHYYLYPTQTDSVPSLNKGDARHTVHYASSEGHSTTLNLLVAVDAHPESQGYYGTLSDANNVAQWTTSADGTALFVRGASWKDKDFSFLQATSSRTLPPKTANNYVGFRMVAAATSQADWALSLKNPNRPLICAPGTTPAIQDSFIYYQGMNQVLYKAKIDGSEEAPLWNDFEIMTSPACCPLLLANTLYFKRSDGALCKVNTDGTGYDWLGYKREPQTAGVYTVHNPITDGTALYFEWNNALGKINSDGTGLSMLDNTRITSAASGCIANGWIYYADENFNLCKVKTTGGKCTPLDVACIANNYCAPLIVEDSVFVITQDSKIAKIKIDGSQIQIFDAKVFTDQSTFPLATDGSDWIYYEGKEDQLLYRIKLDGTENMPLNTLGFKAGSAPVFSNGFLYCQQWDNNQLFKISADDLLTPIASESKKSKSDSSK